MVDQNMVQKKNKKISHLQKNNRTSFKKQKLYQKKEITKIMDTIVFSKHTNAYFCNETISSFKTQNTIISNLNYKILLIQKLIIVILKRFILDKNSNINFLTLQKYEKCLQTLNTLKNSIQPKTLQQKSKSFDNINKYKERIAFTLQFFQKSSPSVFISKFINLLMRKGKKEQAKKIFFETLKLIHVKTKLNPFLILFTALKYGSPVVGLLPVRYRNRSYHLPFPLTKQKRIFLGSKWLVQVANKNKKTKTSVNLANIIQQTFFKKGKIMQKKKEFHQLAAKNRSYARYRWF